MSRRKGYCYSTVTVQRPAGRSLSDALAELPNLSDKIIKSNDQYCQAGGFSDVYKRQYDGGAGLVEVRTWSSIYDMPQPHHASGCSEIVSVPVHVG